MRLARGRVAGAIVLVAAAAAQRAQAQPPDQRERATTSQAMSPELRYAIAKRACEAPLGEYVLGLRFSPQNADIHIDPRTGAWRVDFPVPRITGIRRTGPNVAAVTEGTRPAFRVVIDPKTGRFLEQTILNADGTPAPSMGEALALVRGFEGVGTWLARHEGAWLEPEYRAHLGGWLVRVNLENRQVGYALVDRGRVIRSVGPWSAPSGSWGRMQEIWLRLRPGFSFKHVAYLLTLAFLVLLVDVRRPFSVRTLDAAVLAAFVPAFMLISHVPAAGYVVLMSATAYLVVRLVWRAARPPTAVPAVQRGATGLVVILLAALIWQILNHHEAERSQSEFGGMELGQRFLEQGYIAYGEALASRNVYGPLHYVLYGLAERVFPCGARWDDPDMEGRKIDIDLTASRALGLAFHILAMVAMARLAKGMGGSGRDGLLLATAYILLSVATRRFFTASRVPPAALVVAGLWAWPNPYLSALCLGLASAQMWYPIFLFPLWLGAFRGHQRLKFALVYLATGAAFVGLVAVGPGGPVRRLNTVIDHAVFREGIVPTEAHGVSQGYFWGLLEGGAGAATMVRRGLQVIYVAACAAAFWWPRRKTRLALVALSAALVAGTQLWKPARGGEFLGWYLPPALVALFAAHGTKRNEPTVDGNAPA